MQGTASFKCQAGRNGWPLRSFGFRVFLAPFLFISFAFIADSDASCLGAKIADDAATPRRVFCVGEESVAKLNLPWRKKSLALLVTEHGHGGAVVDGNNLGAHFGVMNLADGRLVWSEVLRFLGLEVIRVEIGWLNGRCFEMCGVEETVEPVLRVWAKPSDPNSCE